MLVFTDRVFADHYQFYVHDEGFDHYADPALDWLKGSPKQFGYLAVERAVYIKTVAHLNTHRVRLYVVQRPEREYERVFQTTLRLDSGTLVISAPANAAEDDARIQVGAGLFHLFVCSSAIGMDEMDMEPDREEPLPEEVFLLRDDFEYYDLYLVPVA